MKIFPDIENLPFLEATPAGPYCTACNNSKFDPSRLPHHLKEHHHKFLGYLPGTNLESIETTVKAAVIAAMEAARNAKNHSRYVSCRQACYRPDPKKLIFCEHCKQAFRKASDHRFSDNPYNPLDQCKRVDLDCIKMIDGRFYPKQLLVLPESEDKVNNEGFMQPYCRETTPSPQIDNRTDDFKACFRVTKRPTTSPDTGVGILQPKRSKTEPMSDITRQVKEFEEFLLRKNDAMLQRENVEKERDAALKREAVAVQAKDEAVKRMEALKKERDVCMKNEEIALERLRVMAKENDKAVEDKVRRMQKLEIVKILTVLQREEVEKERDAALKREAVAVQAKDEAVMRMEALEKEREVMKQSLREIHLMTEEKLEATKAKNEAVNERGMTPN
jgi:hypothetical protein